MAVFISSARCTGLNFLKGAHVGDYIGEYFGVLLRGILEFRLWFI